MFEMPGREPQGLFPLGRTVATPGALGVLATKRSGYAADLFERHLKGDWGDVDREDWQANDQAVLDGDRILSSYTEDGVTLWVITEADRSATTILLPSEY
jgi:hypothetical protein